MFAAQPHTTEQVARSDDTLDFYLARCLPSQYPRGRAAFLPLATMPARQGQQKRRAKGMKAGCFRSTPWSRWWTPPLSWTRLGTRTSWRRGASRRRRETQGPSRTCSYRRQARSPARFSPRGVPGRISTTLPLAVVVAIIPFAACTCAVACPRDNTLAVLFYSSERRWFFRFR